MKHFRRIRLGCILTAALLALTAVCCAEGSFLVTDRSVDLTDTGEISIRRPEITGGEDEALLKQINDRILTDIRMREYLARGTELMSGGSLRVRWKGGILGDVFSCAVSATGAVENTSPTFVWTASNVDLRDGHEITLAELFTNEEAGRERLETYLAEAVEPELSAHLQNSELLPLPDLFWLESTGISLLYPVGRLSTLSDRAGEIRVGWHVLRDELNLGEDSIARRIGAADMITLSAASREKLMEMGAEGSLTDIPVRIGDSMQELTDRHHMLTDPDGFEGGRLFALEGACFRGVYLMTDDLSRDWEKSVVQGIRMDQGCLWGLCVGETLREDWISALGEPDGTAEIDEEKADANRLEAGNCDYYRCGDFQLQLYSDGDGTLISVILTR